MENREIYTVTIVRNIGVPISFTLKRWKVLFLSGFAVLFAVLLLFVSIHYAFLLSKTDELSKKLQISQKKAKLLKGQIAKLDYDRYWTNTEEKNKEISSIKAEILEQSEFSTEGIWITNKPTLGEKDFQEGRSVKIDRFRASIKNDVLKLTVKIRNTSNPPQVVGGYICITLVNKDQSPPLYQLATKGEIGDNGFPSSYLSGKQYYIRRKTSTKHMKFTLTKVNEYYTDAMIFLFSYKGRLLNRQKVALKKEIFLE